MSSRPTAESTSTDDSLHGRRALVSGGAKGVKMADIDYKGQVAIVTGTGRGLGRSHAGLLAARGARVIARSLVSGLRRRFAEP